MPQILQKRGIAIECDDPTHFDCTPVRDELMNFKTITEAYTTDVMEGNSIFCVAGTAVGTSKELKELIKKIRKLRTKKRHLRVDRIEIY